MLLFVSQTLGGNQNPRFISVAVQTPPLESEVPRSLRSDIELLAGAINRFEREAQTMRETLRSRDSPEARSNLHPAISSALGDSEAPPIPGSLPRHWPPPEPLPPRHSLHKTQPDFQHILRVESECLR